MKKIFIFSAAIFCINALSVYGTEIPFFTKANQSWIRFNKQHSPSKFFIDYDANKMGFSPVETTKSLSFGWASKPITIPDGDYYLFRFKGTPGANVTLDIYWDSTGKKQFRPISFLKTDGSWQQTRINIKGKTVRLVLWIKGQLPAGKTVLEVAPLTTHVFDRIKVNTAYFSRPLIIPEVKNYRKTGGQIELVDSLGKSRFTVTGEDPVTRIIGKELTDELHSIPAAGNQPVIIRTILASTPKNPEEYSIECRDNEIILQGASRSALYYASRTLIQMAEFDGKRVYIEKAKIQDWPDLRWRLSGRLPKNSAAKNFKTNQFYSHAFTGSWRKHPQRFLNPANYQLCNERGLGYAPYYWIFPNKGKIKEEVSISVPSPGFEQLITMYDKTLSFGSKFLSIVLDDGVRNPKCFSEVDRKAFDNDFFAWQAAMIAKIVKRLRPKYPNVTFSVTTRNYETATGIVPYFDQAGVPEDVLIFWTGEQCVTLHYSPESVEKYVRGIGGRSFLLYDNTPGQSLGMYRGLTMLETHGSGYGALQRCPQLMGTLGIGSDNILKNIKSYQIADFAWNAYSYNAERSRQRAVAKVAGSVEAVQPCLDFASMYISVALKYPVDQLLKKPKAPLSAAPGMKPVIRKILAAKDLGKYHLTDQEYRRFCQKSAQMKDCLKHLTKLKCNPLLIKEFSILFTNMNSVMKHIYKNQTELPVFYFHSSLDFDMAKVAGGSKTTFIKKLGRNASPIYGKQTPYNIITAQFTAVKPANMLLEVTGMDCDKHLADMEIQINGHSVYRGKSNFSSQWQTRSYSVKSEWLYAGRNIINIINCSPSSDFIDHWIYIGGIKCLPAEK